MAPWWRRHRGRPEDRDETDGLRSRTVETPRGRVRVIRGYRPARPRRVELEPPHSRPWVRRGSG